MGSNINQKFLKKKLNVRVNIFHLILLNLELIEYGISKKLILYIIRKQSYNDSEFDNSKFVYM